MKRSILIFLMVSSIICRGQNNREVIMLPMDDGKTFSFSDKISFGNSQKNAFAIIQDWADSMNVKVIEKNNEIKFLSGHVERDSINFYVSFYIRSDSIYYLFDRYKFNEQNLETLSFAHGVNIGRIRSNAFVNTVVMLWELRVMLN